MHESPGKCKFRGIRFFMEEVVKLLQMKNS